MQRCRGRHLIRPAAHRIGVVHERPVRRIAKRRGPMSKLDRDHPRARQGTDPGHDVVAVGVVGGQERPNLRRDPHPAVGFVNDVKGPDSRGDRMRSLPA